MPSAEAILAVLLDITGDTRVAQARDLRLFDEQVLDSLRSVELLVALNAQFGLAIALSELDREGWATPAHVVSFVQARAAV